MRFVQPLLQWKTISITNSECVFVAFGIQHAKRMRRVTVSYLVCPGIQYFCTLSHKRHDFWEYVTEHKIRILTFTTNLTETFLIPRRIQTDQKCILVFM